MTNGFHKPGVKTTRQAAASKAAQKPSPQKAQAGQGKQKG